MPIDSILSQGGGPLVPIMGRLGFKFEGLGFGVPLIVAGTVCIYIYIYIRVYKGFRA